MTLGSLSSDGWGRVSVLLSVWHKMFIVDLWAVGLSRVLVSIWIPLGEQTPIHITWASDFSSNTASWTQHFHIGSPGQTLARVPKTYKPHSVARGKKRTKTMKRKQAKETQDK